MPTFPTTLTLGLYEGQHPLPDDVQGYIFCENDIPQLPTMSAERLEQLAYNRLWDICLAMGKTFHVLTGRMSPKSLRLYVTTLEGYVTGYTPAFFALLNVCRLEDIAVTLLHYDRDTNSYQEVSI